MKIIYRYIAAKFWGPFLYGLAMFAVLVFLADMFEHLNDIMKSTASLGVILKYFAYTIPFWTLVVVPVASLLAALFVLSEMIHNGEWAASLASGYTPRQVFLPVILCAAVVSCSNFLLQEFVSPKLHKTADAIFERDIRAKKTWNSTVKENVVMKAGENIFISAKRFDPEAGVMNRVVMDIKSDGKVARQVDAQEARWDGSRDRWIFTNGVERSLGASGISEKTFQEWKSEMDIKPGNFIVEKVWPEDLSIRDILKRIKMLRKVGSPVHSEETYLQAKIAAPFSWMIITMLGIPFAVVIRKANKMLHFAAAIVITFVFWWALSIAQTAGEAGLLAPALAAWLPILLFGAISLWGLKKAGA